MIQEQLAHLPEFLPDYRPFPPVKEHTAWQGLPLRAKQRFLQAGEAALQTPIAPLPLSLWLDFTHTGRRTPWETAYFSRRARLCALVSAECVEHKGRFLDEIADTVWAICEESAWQLPAHNSYVRDTPQLPLPDTKILCYDHNYNYDNVAGQQNYPLNIYADADAAQWVDGSAWHNYGGSVSELDNIRAAAPDKTIYFTEASIGTWNYNFESCVIDDFESIFLGTLSRYGKGVLLWNLMLDDKGAPNRPGGCTTCYGAIEISSSDYKTLKYNSHYYDLAQCAKVIRPGAVRIGASGYTASGLTYLAFRNPDGSKAFVALNRSAGEQTVAVYENADRSFKYTIPAKSIASFRWGAGAEN